MHAGDTYKMPVTPASWMLQKAIMCVTGLFTESVQTACATAIFPSPWFDESVIKVSGVGDTGED
jgi:hypothetical protein